MKTRGRKVLSFLMALVMCCSLLQLSVFAAETGEEPAALLSAAAVDSGKIGDVAWELTDDGVLTFTGSGEMKNYTDRTYLYTPWRSYMGSITRVVFSEGITRIGNYLFRDQNYITSISIPESVTEIGEFAFFGCTGIGAVSISASLLTIGDHAFGNCTGVEAYSVAPGNPSYASENGVLYNKAKTTLLCYPMGKSGESFAVPDGVERIGHEAFVYSSLKSITLPDSVNYIDAEAFRQCGKLTCVNNGCGLISIGDRAFQNCEVLAEFDLPNGLTTLGEEAFESCAFTAIALPDSLTNMGSGIFTGCDALKDLTLSETMTSIPDYMFYHCKALPNVTIPDSVKTIGAAAFNDCKSFTEVTIPEGVTAIGDHAYAYCPSLKRVTIPGTVTDFGRGVFEGCGFAVASAGPAGSGCDFEFGWTEVIPDFAFSYFNSLDNITIPDGVTAIGAGAFMGASPINVIIPASLQSIGRMDGDKNGGAVNIFFYGTEAQWNALPGHELFEHSNIFFYIGETEEHRMFVDPAVAATCKTRGNDAYWSCPDCNKYFSDAQGQQEIRKNSWEISAPGHLMTFTQAKEPTQTEAGNTAYWYCSRCGGHFADEQGRTELEEGSWLIPATGYTITYYLDGGINDSENPTEMFEVILKDITLAAPVKTGYIFDGWFEDAAFTMPVSVIKQGTAQNLTFYAKWLQTTPQNITIAPAKAELLTNDALTLKATVTPALASQKVTWSTSDPQIATVNADGVVTAHIYGKTTVTAEAENGLQAQCEIQTRYYDVPKADVYPGTYVYWAADQGITKGYGNVYFDPNSDCDRVSFAIFLWRAAGCPSVSGTMKFKDMGSYKTTADSYKAVLWAYKKGIVNGYNDGTFKPKRTITRAEALIMLYRYKGSPAVSGTLTFKDCKSLKKTSATYKAILWGSKNGITKGYADGTFGKDGGCTRAAMVTFLKRVFG